MLGQQREGGVDQPRRDLREPRERISRRGGELERIRLAGREELMGTPIGQLVGSFRETRTVAETIATLLADYEKTVSALPRLAVKEHSS